MTGETPNDAAALDSTPSNEVMDPTRTWCINAAGELVDCALSGDGKGPISGRYRGIRKSTTRQWKVDLRIDVDRRLPLKTISGDFAYRFSKAESFTHFGSFHSPNVDIDVVGDQVTIRGHGRFTYATSKKHIRIEIANSPLGTTAVLAFFDSRRNQGSVYECQLVSKSFRKISCEYHIQDGVQPIDEYDTALLDSPPPQRTLSITKSFAEFGVNFEFSSPPTVITAPDDVLADSAWSDRELHHAMTTFSTILKSRPSWCVWLFGASRHSTGTETRGVMFDVFGRQRQGCAVFQDAFDGSDKERARGQLRTAMHELGHCFGLGHSWTKGRASNPSYMNSPEKFQRQGTGDYWSQFNFLFDTDELRHLRHGYLMDVVMGGNKYREGRFDQQELIDPEFVVDEAPRSASFRISSKPSFLLGEPVVLEFRLKTEIDELVASSCLHPRFGRTVVQIVTPSNDTIHFQPLAPHCTTDIMRTLTAEHPSVFDSAYVGYGAGGHVFGSVGVYTIFATHRLPNEETVVSNRIRIRITPPHSASEESVVDLLWGDDQGQILAMLGSKSESLESGNRSFDELLQRFSRHPMADYVRLTRGMSDSEQFKKLNADGQVSIEKPIRKRATSALSSLTGKHFKCKDARSARIDSITFSSAIERLIVLQLQANATTKVADVLVEGLRLFQRSRFKASTIDSIKRQLYAPLDGTSVDIEEIESRLAK